MNMDRATTLEHIKKVLSVGLDASKGRAVACAHKRAYVEAPLRRSDAQRMPDEGCLVVERRTMNGMTFGHRGTYGVDLGVMATRSASEGFLRDGAALYAFARMSAFRKQRSARGVKQAHRRCYFVPYDQLTDAVGPLSRADPHQVGIVLVECPAKASRRPYHKQKLALVLTSLRHFALEQAERGVAVTHLVDQSYAAALLRVRELGPIGVMRPAERELRAELLPLVASGVLEMLPNEGWLTTTDDFEAAA